MKSISPENEVTPEKLPSHDIAAAPQQQITPPPLSTSVASPDPSQATNSIISKTTGIWIAALVAVLILPIIGLSAYLMYEFSQSDTTALLETAAADPQNTSETDKTSQSRFLESMPLTSLSGTTYTLGYFPDGQPANDCSFIPEYPCKGLATEDSGRPRSFLIIEPIDPADPNSKYQAFGKCLGQEKPSFTFVTSAKDTAQACETGNESAGILYFSTVIRLSGKLHSVTFTGKAVSGQPFTDLTIYKEDLKQILPTIKLTSR